MPARPLPYNLAVAATVATDRVNLQLSNRGRAGAAFHTRYRTADVAPGPNAQMFTVDARHHLSTTLPPSADGGFDLEVHGPNGFYRRLSGVAAPGPRVTTTAVESAQLLRLALTNRGGRST
jgi:phospholipase C